MILENTKEKDQMRPKTEAHSQTTIHNRNCIVKQVHPHLKVTVNMKLTTKTTCPEKLKSKLDSQPHSVEKQRMLNIG